MAGFTLPFRAIKATEPDKDLSTVDPIDCHDCRIISFGLLSDRPGTQATVTVIWTDGTRTVSLGAFQCTLGTAKSVTLGTAYPLTDVNGNPPAIPCCGACALIGVHSISPSDATITLGAEAK